jgi:competence protein ComEA
MRCSFGLWLWLWLLWAAAAGAAVDLNRASQAELESLPGIGPAKAEAILSYRKRHGPFRRIEELQRVPGIGPATVHRLRPDLWVGPGAPVSPALSLPRLPSPVVAKPGQK